MAHAIIFTDNIARAVLKHGDSLDSDSYPAGAYAIASHLRNLGYNVLVIPYFTKMTFAGLQKIVDDNSKNLLWVGISTSLLSANADTESFEIYRENWDKSSDWLVEPEKLVTSYKKAYTNSAREMPASTGELNKIGAWLKSKYNVPLLVGGAVVTSFKNGFLGVLNQNVKILTGRGESPIEEITKSLEKDKTFPFILPSNDHYDDHDFKSRIYNWTDADMIEPDDWLPLELARGCSFNCAYCNYDRKSTFDSYRNPDILRQELISNYEKYGVTKYVLMDDLYNDSKEKVRILYDKVWSKLPFAPEWTSYMRLDMFYGDPESADIILHSGAKLMTLGIETLNDQAGRKVGKGLGKERILKTLDFLKEKFQDDLLMHSNFIMGFPDESEESMLDTIAWLAQNKVLYSYSLIPLWITPPSHSDGVIKKHQISNDNEKYGITWKSEFNWENKLGMTFERAQEIATQGSKNKNRITIGFSDYPILRSLGLSQKEIANIKSMDEMDSVLKNRHLITDKIYNKLDKFLNYKED